MGVEVQVFGGGGGTGVWWGWRYRGLVGVEVQGFGHAVVWGVERMVCYTLRSSTWVVVRGLSQLGLP